MMVSDGTFSRSLYTPHEGTITFTTQIDATTRYGGTEDGGNQDPDM